MSSNVINFFSKYKSSLLPLVVGLCVSALLFIIFHWWGFLVIFPWIGLSISIGSFLRQRLHGKSALIGRKISILMILPCLLFFVPFVNNENFQLEGVALIVLVGFFNKGFIHYAVAKIFGPLIWRRGFCGHACWTGAVLDWLPIKKKPVKLPERYRNLRFVSLAISLSLPLFLVFVLSYNPWTNYINKLELRWMIIGNCIYYLIAIPLALVLSDRRAFCKYVCPVALVMKPMSSLGLSKIRPNIEKSCIGCQSCDIHCPMTLDVMSRMQMNLPIVDTECILCHDCAVVCPTGKIIK